MPGTFENLLIGQFALPPYRCVILLGLCTELAILTAPPHFGGHDGAEFHVAAQKADADFVGPVKQIVEIVPAYPRQRLCLISSQQLTAQHTPRHPCNTCFHHASIVSMTGRSACPTVVP